MEALHRSICGSIVVRVMDPLAKDLNQIQVTPSDISELLRGNPLAAQQLTAITWHRIALELEAKLAALDLPPESEEA